MQKLDNLFVSELEFDESGMRGPKGESGDAPSLHIEKVSTYLYKASLREYDYDKGNTFVKKNYPNPVQACAAVCKGTMVGHNYDAAYDETAEFVVRTPASRGMNSVIGMASIPGILTADMVDNHSEDDATKDAFAVLPLFMSDGVNGNGVAISMNSMPDEDVSTLTDDSGICALFAVRYLLDRAETAESVHTLIAEQTFWFPQNDSIKAGFYLLISDKTGVYKADLHGGWEQVQTGEMPILTNFRTIGWDGTRETLEKHANGIERYNILSEAYDSIESEEDMFAALSSVRYTGVYDTDREEFWYSDYNGDWSQLGYGDLTIDSDPADYAPAVAYSHEKFVNRQRDGQTMQTMHSAVYDIDKLTLSVMVQEEDKIYRFCMDEINLIYEMFYTKPEVDSALSELNDHVLETVANEYYNKEQSDTTIRELYTTIDNETNEKLERKADAYENAGESGQVLYKTATGAKWESLPTQLPEVTDEDNNKVLAVEDGEWVATDKFADYFRYVNITVNIVSDNGGVPSGGIEVTIKNADTGDVINRADYEGQPVTFRVPRGLNYCIEQSGRWEGYHNPKPAKIEGAATNDITAVFTYEAIKVPETLRELQIIVDGDGASSLKAHVGLQFEDVYTENGVEYPIIWDLKDVLRGFGEDGQLHDIVILEWHYATPTSLPFDAPERVAVDLTKETVAQEGVYYYGLSGTTYRLLSLNTGDPLPTNYDGLFKNAIRSTDASILRRGYSDYGDSAVRKWLNSGNDIGQWFEPSHVGDAAPDQLEMIPGFMMGCSEQILSMARPVPVKYAVRSGETKEVLDTFFIPSVDEVYGLAQGVMEGTAWEDWIEATGLSAPGNGANPGRRIYSMDSSAAQEIGLRTMNAGYQYITWDIKPDGSLDGYVSASTLRKFSPCCAVYK